MDNLRNLGTDEEEKWLLDFCKARGVEVKEWIITKSGGCWNSTRYHVGIRMLTSPWREAWGKSLEAAADQAINELLELRKS